MSDAKRNIIEFLGHGPFPRDSFVDQLEDAIAELIDEELVNTDVEGVRGDVLSLSDEGWKAHRAIEEGEL